MITAILAMAMAGSPLDQMRYDVEVLKSDVATLKAEVASLKKVAVPAPVQADVPVYVQPEVQYVQPMQFYGQPSWQPQFYGNGGGSCQDGSCGQPQQRGRRGRR
jgi:hypothetical protein